MNSSQRTSQSYYFITMAERPNGMNLSGRNGLFMSVFTNKPSGKLNPRPAIQIWITSFHCHIFHNCCLPNSNFYVLYLSSLGGMLRGFCIQILWLHMSIFSCGTKISGLRILMQKSKYHCY